MPVQKFRSLDEARKALWSEGGSPENLRRLRFSYEFWSRVHPRQFPRGVWKYRSLQEANRAEDGFVVPEKG